MKTMRAFYAAVARAINARNLRHPALDAMSTAKRQARNEILFDSELGNRAPGPVPFTPIGVRSNGSTARTVLACVLGDGFTLDPKTDRPAHPRVVRAIQAELVEVGGRWKVDRLTRSDFSCTGVEV